MYRRLLYGFKLNLPLRNRSNGFWHRILTHTVRYGFDVFPTVRFGAVLINQESDVAVLRYPTARFGPVIPGISYGAVR